MKLIMRRQCNEPAIQFRGIHGKANSAFRSEPGVGESHIHMRSQRTCCLRQVFRGCLRCRFDRICHRRAPRPACGGRRNVLIWCPD